MRPVNPLNVGQVKDVVARALIDELARASQENDVVDIASAFDVTGSYTETRTLDVGTSTLTQTQAFIATLLADLKRGGQHRAN